MPPVPLNKLFEINSLLHLTEPQMKLSLIVLVSQSWAQTVPVCDDYIGSVEVIDKEKEQWSVLMR